MASRGGYKGKNFDPNYRNRGRGRGNNLNVPRAQDSSFNSDGFAVNSSGSNANQTVPAGNNSGRQVSDEKIDVSSASKRKSRRNPRKKKKNLSGGTKTTKLAKSTKLALDVKVVDFRRSKTNYFCPSFAPLQEVYFYLKPRMNQYFNDYIRSISSTRINFNYEFFYQSFAYRVSELYLSKIWLYSAPERFLSAHYDRIKSILNSTQPLIKEMVQDVSEFIGNFELHDKQWVNKFPLLVVAHHWLQSAYGYTSELPFEHKNQAVGLSALRMTHLPIVITPIVDDWPIPLGWLDLNADGSPNYLSSAVQADDIRCSLRIQHWDRAGAQNLNKVTLYYFNGMVDPADLHAWHQIPTNRDVNNFDYHVAENNEKEVHPTFACQPDANPMRPCLTRFFPWREATRTKSGHIIQFNCEFLRCRYNDRYIRGGLEDISMSLASTLLQLIGCEIDNFMDYWGAEFIIPNGFKFKKSFAIKEAAGFSFEFVNSVILGNILIEYTDDSKTVVREHLPTRLKYKLPLWWHAYDDFDTLNDMTGFLHPDNGYDDNGVRVDDDEYDIERHWWKWCMAGIYPRWSPYRIITENLECHWIDASSNVQLDFLKSEMPIDHYRVPDSNGSSAQLSRHFIKDQSENIYALESLSIGEMTTAFILTDRANWISPVHLGPWNSEFTWLTHFEGLDQQRRIRDIISSFFPQSAWTISNQKN